MPDDQMPHALEIFFDFVHKTSDIEVQSTVSWIKHIALFLAKPFPYIIHKHFQGIGQIKALPRFRFITDKRTIFSDAHFKSQLILTV